MIRDVFSIGDPVYSGAIQFTSDTSGNRFPIEAFSTTDNSSLTYSILFNDPNIIILDSITTELVVLPSSPPGQYFIQVI